MAILAKSCPAPRQPLRLALPGAYWHGAGCSAALTCLLVCRQTDVSQVLAGSAKPYAWLQLLCGLPVDVTDRQQHLALVKVGLVASLLLQGRLTVSRWWRISSNACRTGLHWL